MDSHLLARVEAAIGRRPMRLSPLSGGCIAEVFRAEFSSGPPVVLKFEGVGKAADRGPDGGTGVPPVLLTEALMLSYLAEHSTLPVPRVLYTDPSLLILEFIESDGAINARAQRHAAELLAGLHSIRPPAEHAADFGFPQDTLIGPLRQPNPWTRSWVDFFREQRLLYMARLAARAGRLDPSIHARLQRFASRLGELIHEPPHPSLIHGDIWGGNVLPRAGRIAAFIDPAICYAHPEQELAFTTLFGTFSTPFFDRYAELRPLPPGFFDGPRPRRDIYNLYPLLVHVRLFGGSYQASVEQTLGRMGF